MGSDVGDVEELMSRIFESLANPVRRRVLEVLSSEGPLPFTELMRRCGIRDSRTLKHHLEKLESLVVKGRGGSYVVTRLGREVLKFVELLREELIDVLTFIKSRRPLITYRSSIRHYVVAVATLLVIAFIGGIVEATYVSLTSLITSLALTVLAGIRRSRLVIIGVNSITEVVRTPLSNSRRVVRCALIGAEIHTNPLLKLIGLAKVSLIIDTGGSVRTYGLGLSTIDDASKYVEMINKMLEGVEVKHYLT